MNFSNAVKKLPLLGASLLMWPVTSNADSLDLLGELTQGQFLKLSENVAAVTQYKAFAPAEPLGVLGFDVAIEVSGTDIDSELFDIASTGGFDASTFLLPRVHVHKGLPFKLDVAASLGVVPETDFQVLGAELRYAILEGTVATPAVAVRLAASQISGVDELDMNNIAAEISISKGFVMFTPYAGVGIVRTTSTPKTGNLSKETFDQSKVYGGVNINLGINFGLEFDVTGDYTTYSVKAGFRF